MLICRTGARTTLGKLADALIKPPAADVEIGLSQFSVLIMRITLVLNRSRDDPPQ